MLKRWKELAEPSFSSCLQSIPGVYTRAEILREDNENDDEDLPTPQNEPEGEEIDEDFYRLNEYIELT